MHVTRINHVCYISLFRIAERGIIRTQFSKALMRDCDGIEVTFGVAKFRAWRAAAFDQLF